MNDIDFLIRFDYETLVIYIGNRNSVQFNSSDFYFVDNTS